MGELPGTLLTLSPAAMELPMLLRVAIDAEQIGVTRLQVPTEIDDPEKVVAALRDQTSLILTAMADSPSTELVDLVGHSGSANEFGWIPIQYRTAGSSVTRLIELKPDNNDESTAVEMLPAMTTSVAKNIDHYRPLPISLAGNGDGALLVSLASLAAGGHISVGPLSRGGDPRQNVALAAKAGGIARLAGRPALTLAAAMQLLGLG